MIKSSFERHFLSLVPLTSQPHCPLLHHPVTRVQTSSPSCQCHVLTGSPQAPPWPLTTAESSGCWQEKQKPSSPHKWLQQPYLPLFFLSAYYPRKTSGAVNHAKSLDNMTPSVSRDQDKSSAYISLRAKQSRAASSPGVSVSPLLQDGEKIVSANRGEVYSLRPGLLETIPQGAEQRS